MKSELLKSRKMSLRVLHFRELFIAIQYASWIINMCELRHIPQLQLRHINEGNSAQHLKGLKKTAKQILVELSDIKHTS